MSFSRRSKERIADAVRKIERLAPTDRRRRPRPAPRATSWWVGRVVEKGPEGEGDFPDHVYWAEPLSRRPVNEETASRHAAAIMDTYPLGHDSEVLNFAQIRSVTNQSEVFTRGHLLWLNQPVLCMTTHDEFNVVKHLTFTSPPQPWMWVRITAAAPRPGLTNQWFYTGVRQQVGDTRRFITGLGFYARTVTQIINPAEAYNDGQQREGNSINVSTLSGCSLVEVRGDPVVAIAPTLINFNPDANTGDVVWSIIGYPNSVDRAGS